MEGKGAPGTARGTPVLRLSRSCAIRLSELVWTFSPSGGPGGQHANTSNTRAEVRFNVAASESLGPRQRARLLERLGSEVRAAARDERSQAQNRQLALERLRSKLADALRTSPPRKPTKPSATADNARLEAKRRRGKLKRSRRGPELD